MNFCLVPLLYLTFLPSFIAYFLSISVSIVFKLRTLRTPIRPMSHP